MKDDEIVNNPVHYKLDGLDTEPIEIIESILGKNYKYYCLGSVLVTILK